MSGGAMIKGTQRTLLNSAVLIVGTTNSPDWWLVEGGGLLVIVDVENINGATITDVNIQAKNGDNYDTVAAFAAQAITANGRYMYRMAAGASRAAGASAYKGAVEDTPPTTGRVAIINTVATPTVSVRVKSVG